MQRPEAGGYVPPNLGGGLAQADEEEAAAPLLDPPGRDTYRITDGKPVRRSSSEAYHSTVHVRPHQVAFDEAGNVVLAGEVAALLDAPDRLWQQQRAIMVTWLAASAAALVMFAPFFFSSSMFMGAQAAAILGVCAGAMHLWKSSRLTGAGLLQQVQAAARFGAAAAVLDAVSALLALMLVAVADCDSDAFDLLYYEDCQSLSGYLLAFSAFLALHGYLSACVAARAVATQRCFNPVSAGLLRL